MFYKYCVASDSKLYILFTEQQRKTDKILRKTGRDVERDRRELEREEKKLVQLLSYS